MKRIEVLWLIEHIAREMDVACAVKCLAQHQYGLDIKIRHIYLHANQVMAEYKPNVVVYPFFYFLSGALAQEDYVKIWPHATHFNLAWEEIFYKAHEKVKAPADEFTKKTVIHHAWGNFYKNYLLKNDVPSEHIFVNGNPAYQLYLDPYNRYYECRGHLANKYGLDNTSRWIFVPENYRWAFIAQSKIKKYAAQGENENELLSLQKFCKESLIQLLNWCNEAAGNEKLEIIFRPRPTMHSTLLNDLVKQHVGTVSPNLHFIKDGSVREWILASDVVVSSFSTSLIEASIANKPVYMAEPFPIPQALYYEWLNKVPSISSVSEFMEVCLKNNEKKYNTTLKSWAHDEMLANGDPIRKISEFINQLARENKQAGNTMFNKFQHGGIKKFRLLSRKKKKYFNEATHENDVFTEEEIQKKVGAWRKILID